MKYVILPKVSSSKYNIYSICHEQIKLAPSLSVSSGFLIYQKHINLLTQKFTKQLDDEKDP